MKVAIWLFIISVLMFGEYMYMRVDAQRQINQEMEWQRKQSHAVSQENTKYRKENKHLVYIISKNRKESCDE